MAKVIDLRAKWTPDTARQKQKRDARQNKPVAAGAPEKTETES
ncbi:hypothetical protein [Vibrio phage TCU_VP01_ZB]|uniref:Uncharacterized protein n=6 Tax=Maculvirus TaxID=2731958 RepID=A0A8F3HMI1_9CAUD|nr:hypothetical protein [Vibrio phage vB_VpP_FE11]QPP19728.1 hypothetical protein [Vibrio phage vB_VpP_DE17]QWE49792.1 hypothetical protein [Vibrio phage BUCT233]QWY13571.1 hypothetical protein [Vibrio phage vB_VpP_DE18]QYW05869.1 hypothetical protein [Vibrio phage vB_VpP_NS8]UPO38845.1 hypothetical protein GHSM17_16 [Vibrio phage vB_VpaP_GHSM17]UUW39447.1 hypothetical protein vBVpaP1701_14 [Vibrio phage vB_VpaP_1701]WDS30393.1 disordered protein [Vibrio phage SSJ01]WDS60794.1 hypothetical 